MNDPIADMITRIKNAGDAGKESLLVSYSKMKFEIATILEREGYIKSVAKKGKKISKFIEIELLYEGGVHKIQGVDRVSKSSKRVYQKSREMKPVRHGFGSLVVTTSKGILTDREAKKQKIGGEALFKVW